MGAGAQGFSAGLAQGLAKAMGASRDRQERDRRQRQQQAQAMMTTLMNSGQVRSVTDLGSLFHTAMTGEDAPTQPAPKRGKKADQAPDPMSIISQVLDPALAMGAGAGMNTGPATQAMEQAPGAQQPQSLPITPGMTQGQEFEQVPPAARPATPTAGARLQTPQSTESVMGVPIMSPQDAITFKTDQDIYAKQAFAERVMPIIRQSAATLQQTEGLSYPQAMEVAGAMFGINFGLTTGYGSSAMRFGGVVQGNQLPPDEVDAYGRPVVPTQFYRVSMSPDGLSQTFMPTTAPAAGAGGTDLTAAAVVMGYRSPNEVPPERRGELEATAERLRKERNYAGASGTAQAVADAPVTVPQSQQTGIPVGTPGSALTGQVVPQQPDIVRRRNAVDIKSQLDHIKTLLPGTLPTAHEIGSLAPGAVMFARQRMPSYRDKVATLESAINNIRAVLTRTMQANVGTETERDSERALSTIANFYGSLFDPASGDTVESATARIDETLKYLEQVLGSLPATPVPTATAAPAAGTPPPVETPITPPPPVATPTPAPAAAAPAGPGGVFIVNGVLVDADGNPIQ